MSKTDDYGWEEAPPESAGYINPAVLRIVRSLNPKKILDAGCGNGALAGALAQDGYTVHGIDGDPKGIEFAQRRYPTVQFTVGTFDEASTDIYDVVCTTEVIEHLYAPHELAQYCFNALRPGGTIIVSTPYHGYLKNLAISIVNGWDEHHTANWHGGHIKFWSKKTLSDLLQRVGFEAIEFRGVGRLPLLWKSMILIAKRPL